jgi:hypothetical protein
MGYNVNGGFGAGLTTILSSGTMAILDEESPTVPGPAISSWCTGGSNASMYFWTIFPELVDISYQMQRQHQAGGNGYTFSFSSAQSSPDTTTGVDGTWSNLTFGSGTQIANLNTGGDWWRSTAPSAITVNGTGIKAIRFQILASGGNINSAAFMDNQYFWGTKHSGQTPDDIVFLEADDATEWPNDDDWGDVQAASTPVSHTYYVQNSSSGKTANTITIKSSGSDSGQWTVSLDNVSFGASQSVASLGPGASQIVYFKFTPPSSSGGNLRPYAAYLEADVVSWS